MLGSIVSICQSLGDLRRSFEQLSEGVLLAMSWVGQLPIDAASSVQSLIEFKTNDFSPVPEDKYILKAGLAGRSWL